MKVAAMKAFAQIDMREVTRLTRAGKLAEAMALLQGASSTRAAAPSDAFGSTPPPSPAPSHPLGDTWRRWLTSATGQPVKPASPRGFERTTPASRDRLRTTRTSRGVEGFARAGRSSIVAPEGARFEERAFAGVAGERTYKIYVPSGFAGQALPVVVMLHGCTQDPDDFAAGTRMNRLAEEQMFLVAYPRQPRSANLQKCWNWFKAEDQQRGGGEPSLIAGVASQVVEEFSADATRVYVAGLSAGGAAAAIMGATYPDLFAAVGVHSGLACGAARDVPSAFAAMAGKATIRPRLRQPVPPTIVFHGDADRTVNPVNGNYVMAGARREDALATTTTRGETAAGVAYTRTVQIDAQGREVLEQWVLHGAGHAWSGGSSEGSYTDARGPDASREMIRFFLKHAKETL